MAKVYYAASLSLPQGFRMRGYDESDVLALTKDPKQLVRIADVMNLYCHQKGGLVWGRSDLCELVETKLKFKPVTKKVKKDGEEVEEWDESEAKYLDRFAESVAKGDFKVPNFTPTGASQEEKEKSVWTLLQGFADKLGDVTEKGEPCFDSEGKPIPDKVPHAYANDITRTEPKPRKPKGPSKDAMDGALQILNGGPERIKAWAEKFSKGYTDPNGIVIAPFTFQPFDKKPSNGAKAEEIEAIKQENQRNLALAIDTKESQVRAYWQAKRKAEFA